MRVVAIIQARLGSERLPGKVLQDLAGQSMLARVVRRVRRAAMLQEVVVATTESAGDAPLVEECRRLNVPWFRGNEHDVLDRYYSAAEQFRAEVVVRITADCPLIDASLVDRVVRGFLQHRPDYVSNIHVRTFPRGLDTEAVAFDSLVRAWCEAAEPYERGHVTPYFYLHPELFRLLAVRHDVDLSDQRWTVDTAEDLRFARAVYDRFEGSDRFTWRDVLSLLDREPELAAINRHVCQKPLRAERVVGGGTASSRRQVCGVPIRDESSRSPLS